MKRKRYTEDFKRAVALMYARGMRVRDICEEVGATRSAVYNWVELYGERKQKDGCVTSLSEQYMLKRKEATMERR